VLGWVVRCMYLRLVLIFFVSFGPFLGIVVAIGFVIVLCCFVDGLLVFVFDLYLFMRI
jgi:hypothetical protein